MAFKRLLHPHRSNRDSLLQDQFAPDGRNLSDQQHPDYDPTTDPELPESIHESIREDDRRRIRRLASRRNKKASGADFDPSSSSGLKPRRSIFSRRKRATSISDEPLKSPTRIGFQHPDDEEEEKELGPEERAHLERQRTRANAAAEAEESARRQEKQDEATTAKADKQGKSKGKKEGKGKGRRVVYVNLEGAMTDPRSYERNKVRTSKYTLITFIPKNLTEQFRRVANIYFLALVILQVFPIFGAASAQIGMLPLVAILCITAIKDGIEDSRRHSLDNGVNNSAVTRLGDWKNVNQPIVSTKWWHLGGLFRSSATKSSKISKGVRKLREKEGTYDAGFLYVDSLEHDHQELEHEHDRTMETLDKNDSTYTIDAYPPTRSRSHTIDSAPYSYSASNSGHSQRSSSRKSSDVVSYDHATPGTAKWERTLWKKLEVGDVVLLKEDDQIPADIVVLSTSDPEGVCYVETKNLDGETNLKPRKSLKATMGIGNEEDVEHARFWVDSEPPHANLYSYNAVLRYRSRGEAVGREHPIQEGRERQMDKECQEPITINELLLRGCALRNTKWVIGLVVFTGADTKIMLNQGETPSKRSKIEKETNFNVLANFVILMALCIGCAIADGVYDRATSSSANFYEPGAAVSPIIALSALVTFGATLILFQNIVPISLVITVELVKTIQAFFIYQDLDMYYEPLDHPCLPKTWNISDDLGQIEYVFSDKTGTLTQNVMEFQKCAVGGVAYGEGITEAMLGAAKREGRDTSAFDPAQNVGHLAARKDMMLKTLKSAFKNRYLREDRLTLISPPLAQDLATRSEHQRQITEFWRALAICHTVIADRFDPDNDNLIEYKAESPDEAALVAAARDVGFVFVNRTNAAIDIEVMGQPERYVPLRVLAFNSSRKRMSTLVRTPDNRILLICKGADSVIYQRLREDHDPELIASTTRHLEDFANAGLRTLCISSKYVTEEEFSKWSKIYDAACASIEDREEEIERACEMIEGDLTILGATALEDKLQEGVPEAIAQLHKAGLKLWILTGDKLQTAIEIGFSCNLLSNEMEIMIISADSELGTRAQIEAAHDKVTRAAAGLGPRADEKAVKTGGFAVVIDGETLRYALEDGLKPMFLDLTTQCDTVVCCRVSPSQKALTVKLVKDGKGAMTLAIGDGANDVAMIQEAHIGVGIAGLEGAQASMSADYAVGQFRYLTKLLLVHGRWCYIRVADMHATFFYKNIVWTLTLFLYQIYCNFDATYLYDYTLIMLFNLVFTSLPVAVLGIFDKDVSAETSLAVPQLYRRGIAGLEWTRPKFFGFMADGLYQSFISFFCPYMVFSMSASHSVNGHDFSVWEFGTTVAACAVTSANLFVGFHIRYWTWMVFVIIIGSTLAFHVWIAIYSQFPVFTFENQLTYLYSTLPFWMSLLVTQVASIGPKFVYKYIRSAYYPQDSDIIREMEVLNKAKSCSMDVEAHRQEEQALFGSGNMGPPTPALSDTDRRERTFSNESSAPDDPHLHYSPARSLSSAQQQHYGPHTNIPTINIQGTTPRGSMASGRTGASEFEGHDDGRWDLHGVSPLEQTRREARRQASDGSWKTADEGHGYAM